MVKHFYRSSSLETNDTRSLSDLLGISLSSLFCSEEGELKYLTPDPTGLSPVVDKYETG